MGRKTPNDYRSANQLRSLVDAMPEDTQLRVMLRHFRSCTAPYCRPCNTFRRKINLNLGFDALPIMERPESSSESDFDHLAMCGVQRQMANQSVYIGQNLAPSGPPQHSQRLPRPAATMPNVSFSSLEEQQGAMLASSVAHWRATQAAHTNDWSSALHNAASPPVSWHTSTSLAQVNGSQEEALPKR
mmetsp:Transcript_75004/g.124998  ORF Transcript_75004/g.124998 Transcript_75004/m.124998 type:complete len:187 (+) Transcript_75004:37-597(+)